ncbi:MAG: hypothetical protein GXP52_04850 [Deltaproteobacteria bacterium]|nr:hypothetical protein [Deltaproteobacteria bacterium]
MDLKKNDDQVISLFQKVYTGEREPVFSRRIQTDHIKNCHIPGLTPVFALSGVSHAS